MLTHLFDISSILSKILHHVIIDQQVDSLATSDY